MKNDKWSMFKNYMHNELGITKEDIQKWLKDAIQEEARKLVKQTYGEFSVQKEIEKVLFDTQWYGHPTFKKQALDAFSSALMQKLDIKIKGE